jgi:hypothetical protein
MHLVVVPPHDMHIGRDSPQVLVRLLVTNIACAQYLLNLPRNQKLLELCWQIVNSVWDVNVADDQYEHHP